MRGVRVPDGFRLLLAAALLISFGSGSAAPQAPSPPVDRDFKAEVTVRLGEVQVLVTDKAGRAITDLRADEIELVEGGQKRRIAFLDPFATRDLEVKLLPKPAPLVAVDAPAADEDSTALRIPVPKPVRRVVLLFDAYNSRRQDHARWTESARAWVEKEMRPEDRIAIAAVGRGVVNTVVSFTGDRTQLLGFLQGTGFLPPGEFHDYAEEMKGAIGNLETCDNAYDRYSCSTQALVPIVNDWAQRTRLTLTALSQFTATLAAVPGRKSVILFSHGLVLDPSSMAGTAMLSKFGSDVIPVRAAMSTFQVRLQGEFLAFTRQAVAARTTFFTFDTRNAALASQGRDVDVQAEGNERRMADPFGAIFDETRAAVGGIAVRTGGRTFNGPRVEANLSKAIGAIEGLYTVGFYREVETKAGGRLKLKVARKDVEVSFLDRYEAQRGLPQVIRLEVGVGKPRPETEGAKLALPVTVQVPLVDLPFRQEDDSRRQAVVAVYVEAVTPEGERVAESFETVTASVSEVQYEKRIEAKFAYATRLALSPGSYRLRIRLSEQDFKRAAERAIDITLGADLSVRPGLQNLGRGQEIEQKPAAPPGSPSGGGGLNH